MQYELFFSYNLEENFDVIYEHISKRNNSWKIICDNMIITNKLKEKGVNIKPWKITTNEDFTLSKKIYTDAKSIQESYLQIFKEIRFRDVEIFRGFDYSLLMQLSIMTKSKIFLEDKQDTIFIFSTFFEIYFAFNRFFKELGYSNDGKIGFIKNQKIQFLTLENFSETSKYRDEFSKKRLKIFSKSLSGDKSLKKNLQESYKLSLKLFSYLFSSLSYKLFHSKKKNYIEIIIKKIDRNISTNKKLMTTFFVTTSRGDTYLKPWQSVFEKFKKENIDFVIITSDFATSVLLSKEKIPFISLFNEINILKNELSNNEIGLEVKKNISKIIEENEHIYGLKELKNYFIAQALKAISIIIICKNILEKFPIRSVVALADGEMLENLSLQVAKKHSINNFSMLPVIVPPHAILTDWFHADKIFVAGKNAIDSLTSLGYDKNRLIITGNPLYDYTKKINPKESKCRLEIEFKINSLKKLVVIGTWEYHIDDELLMSKLIKFCNKNNWEIILKLHPKWKRSVDGLDINKIEKECKNQKFLISYDIDIKTLLSAADLVITDYSNIGLEAICLEKPLFTVNFEKENLQNIIKYHDYGASLYFENYSELEKSLKEVLTSELHDSSLKIGRQNFLEQFNYGNDGNANKRIFEWLTKFNY